MKHKLLPIILQYLPPKQRPIAANQLNYYESQIDYWSREKGKKFKFSRDEISVLLQAAIFYQFIYVALEDSKSFFVRMQEFDVKSVKAGNLILTQSTITELKKLSTEFKKIINFFFSSHKLDHGIEVLGFEDITDFIKIMSYE